MCVCVCVCKVVYTARFLSGLRNKFSVALRPHQRRGAQDGHLDFHTAPELCLYILSFCLMSSDAKEHIRDNEASSVSR